MTKYITNPIHSLTQSNTAATITSLLTQQPRTGTSQQVLPGPSSIENDAHGIEKLLLITQVSLTSFLQSEVKIIHIIVQNNTFRELCPMIVLFGFVRNVHRCPSSRAGVTFRLYQKKIERKVKIVTDLPMAIRYLGYYIPGDIKL